MIGQQNKCALDSMHLVCVAILASFICAGMSVHALASREDAAWTSLLGSRLIPGYPCTDSFRYPCPVYGRNSEAISKIAVEFNSSGITPEDVESWMRFFVKVDPDIYAGPRYKLSPTGFQPGSGGPSLLTIMKKIKQTGLEQNEAERWLAIKFTVAAALDAKEKGLTLSDAAQAMDKGVSASQVTDWGGSGIPSADVPTWVNLRYSPSDAKAWLAAGFTLDEVSKWGPGIKPAEAATWAQNGWDASEGKAWKARTRSLNTAIAWKQAGFSIEDYSDWSRVGCKQTGFYGKRQCSSPEVMSRWRQAGFSPEDASRWMADGVQDPAQAKRARGKERSKEQSKECADVIDTDQKLLRSYAEVALQMGRVSDRNMRAACAMMPACIKSCGKRKCGSIVPKLFGGPALLESCASLSKADEDLLSPPK